MRSLLLISLAVLPMSQSAMAHDDHKHEASVEAAPHGGTLRDAGDLKAEVVLSGELIKLYVYDKNLKPLKLDKAELKGDVQFPREKVNTITFKKSKTGDFYETTVKGIDKVHRYDMHVMIEAGGKSVKADFGIDNLR